MDITALIIQLVSGAVGGNVAGALLKKFSLGPIGNSIVGILGGGLGGQLLTWLGVGAGGGGATDISSLLTSIAGGGVGGGILMVIIGVIRKALSKTP